MSLRRIYLREDPKAKKAMANIVKRGIAASPQSDKEWGDALLQAVDQFDISVKQAGGEPPKKASAVGKKPAAAGKPQGAAGDSTYDPKVATRSAKPKASEPSPPPPDEDDDWFMDDEPELGAAGKGAAPAKAKKKAARQQPQPEPGTGDDDFPDLPAPQAASFEVGGDDAEEYNSPFANLGFGRSSWDDVPDWMRDAEKMPRAGGGSMRIPGAAQDSPSGPSPVGRPWTEKDLDPKKKGLLGRLFGRKK